ncbi:MAG: 4-hydroxy-tetrahydrodipicolinate synthase [Nitrospira sp.]|nr:4-hydroxy-tetrahydrodipicolinate synthase [Nitrospira sp.]
MFTGSHVAIVTPFRKSAIDERAFSDLIEWQIASGTNGIVPCGTTGESATLSHEEHNRVIELTVEIVNRRVPVIAGTGSNSTDEAIALTQHAKRAGADGALLITPYYNKPTQEGLYRHYKAVAESVDLPLVLYNIPGRTGVNMLPSTIARLSAIKTIVGVKEGSGSVQQASDMTSRTDDRRRRRLDSVGCTGCTTSLPRSLSHSEAIQPPLRSQAYRPLLPLLLSLEPCANFPFFLMGYAVPCRLKN